MNSYTAAISKLNNNTLKIGSEIVSIKDALNRISSKEVIAKSDYPADDNTAFDGFAVNSKETKNTFQKFKILKTIACHLYTSPSPRDKRQSRMPSSA